MSKTSWAGRVIDIEDPAFDVGAPVSAGQAFLLRNNIAHAIDSSTQTRISWCTTNLGSGQRFTVSGGPALYKQEFPLSYLSERKPANLYVKVKLSAVDSSGGASFDYRVGIVPARSLPGSFENAILDVQGSATDGTLVDVEQLLVGEDFLPQIDLGWTGVGVVNDGGALFRPVQLCLLRLEVLMSFPSWDSEDDFHIHKVFVREYA